MVVMSLCFHGYRTVYGSGLQAPSSNTCTADPITCALLQNDCWMWLIWFIVGFYQQTSPGKPSKAFSYVAVYGSGGLLRLLQLGAFPSWQDVNDFKACLLVLVHWIHAASISQLCPWHAARGRVACVSPPPHSLPQSAVYLTVGQMCLKVCVFYSVSSLTLSVFLWQCTVQLNMLVLSEDLYSTTLHHILKGWVDR